MYPDRGRTVHLAESLNEIMGKRASGEAARRMVEAVDDGTPNTALLWFDVWALLEDPAVPGQSVAADNLH